MTQAPDKYGFAHFLKNDPLVFYPVLTFVMLLPVSIMLNDSHSAQVRLIQDTLDFFLQWSHLQLHQLSLEGQPT